MSDHDSDLRFKDVRRFWETVRHLKFEQVFHRLWFHFYSPAPDKRASPPLRNLFGEWVGPARRVPSMVGPESFRFLNKFGTLSELGWDGDNVGKLWRYNQHYFDDLNAADSKERHEWHFSLIERWIAENDPGVGTGWEPYPTSLRIVNWVKWALAGNEVPSGFRQSLAVQARWLSQRLERHLLGNHLFANGKALIFVGTLIGGKEGNSWQENGVRILMREIPRQILQDGGHFELSPMYHALAVEDILDLINILRMNGHPTALLSICEKRLPDMQLWLSAMSHSDGDIAFFNDTAVGIAPPTSELADYAARLRLPVSKGPAVIWLRDSGYVRLSVGDGLLFADVAQVGPSYLPGHAHADTLSFEFSLGPSRVFVNGGTSEYGVGAERLRQRGTEAHNCVSVEGLNSSDVWSGFRVGLRARPLTPVMNVTEEGITLRAGHDGYRSLPGSPEHWRTWSVNDHSLVIDDLITEHRLKAEAYFHLHPNIHVEMIDHDTGVLVLKDGRQIRWKSSNKNCRVVPNTWHPEFGISIASQSIVVPLHGGKSTFTVYWG